MEYDQRLYDDRCTITATDPLNNTATRRDTMNDKTWTRTEDCEYWCDPCPCCGKQMELVQCISGAERWRTQCPSCPTGGTWEGSRSVALYVFAEITAAPWSHNIRIFTPPAPKAPPVITYDLDPCPHCRGEMNIHECDCGKSYWVVCDGDCEIAGPTAPTEEEATRAFLSLMVGWKHWAYRRKED
jgi:hypothetical protein